MVALAVRGRTVCSHVDHSRQLEHGGTVQLLVHQLRLWHAQMEEFGGKLAHYVQQYIAKIAL